MKRTIWTAVLLLVIGMAGMVAGCGGSGTTPASSSATTPASSSAEEQPADDTYVEFTLKAKRNGDTIKLSGTTNLPDGALLAYSLEWAQDLTEGTLLVSDGRFEGSVSDVPSGPVEAWVAFQTILGAGKSQPQELIDRFGEMGENMTGPDVVTGGDLKRAEKVVTVD